MPIQPTAAGLQVTEATRAALTGLLNAFARGDGAQAARYYHDDVDWLFHAPHSVFPFAGVRHGKDAVLAGFAVLFADFDIVDYRVDAVLVDGDRAATLSDGQFVQRASGRIIRVRTGNFYRFRDGLVTEYRGFTDSLDIVEQVLGRELDF